MSSEHDRHVAMSALRAAIPYLRLYQGRTFVIKAGGEAFASPETTRNLMEQVAVLHRVGIRVVLVHGGGIQTTRLSQQLGLEPQMVEGRRVTCDRTLEASMMALCGEVNTRLVASARGAGIPAVGLSCIDAGLITARRRPPRQLESGDTLDYGHVGDIVTVDATVLRKLMEESFLPIVSPLSADAAGLVLNVNADSAAAALACGLGAYKLIMVTSVTGIRADPRDPDSLVSYTDLAGLERLRAGGSLEGGMLPKTAAIRTALEGGVGRVHVISFEQRDGLLLEVFTNEGSGTLIVRDSGELRPEEAQGAAAVAAAARAEPRP